MWKDAPKAGSDHADADPAHLQSIAQSWWDDTTAGLTLIGVWLLGVGFVVGVMVGVVVGMVVR